MDDFPLKMTKRSFQAESWSNWDNLGGFRTPKTKWHLLTAAVQTSELHTGLSGFQPKKVQKLAIVKTTKSIIFVEFFNNFLNFEFFLDQCAIFGDIHPSFWRMNVVVGFTPLFSATVLVLLPSVEDTYE